MINMFLKDYQWNFGFFQPWGVYKTPSLLKTDGFHLSKRGKRTLDHELAGLFERAFN